MGDSVPLVMIHDWNLLWMGLKAIEASKQLSCSSGSLTPAITLPYY